MNRFKDRTDAGRILAGALSRAGYRAPVVWESRGEACRLRRRWRKSCTARSE